MKRHQIGRVLAAGILFILGFLSYFYLHDTLWAGARNVHNYSDLITNSGPGELANHTFAFDIRQAVPAGGYFDIDFPSGFEVATSSMYVRNVELYVDGVARTASDTLSTTLDQVLITPGDSGSVRYNLNTTTGIPADANLEFRIGNHTSTALPQRTVYSTTTGTTTLSADPIPISNADSTGKKEITMTVGGTTETTYADFVIYLVDPIQIEGVDTTEEIPPFRFNGAPDGEIGGTTLFVEISLETNEFAVCKYSQTASTTYAAMTNTFDDTGLVVHTKLVATVPDELNTYYVRCIDDEGNFNTDDFLISFYVPNTPAGTSNTDGEVSGDGTGSGDDGTGDGSGSGGTTGSADGGANTTGGSSGGGGGGSGGSGGGGGTGDDTNDEAGGGFESTDGLYPSGDARVIVGGYSFPNSQVYVLVDGNNAESGRANSSGSYSITIDGIARGVYTFGVYAIDAADTRSTTFSTSFTVTGGRTSNLSNINIMPSILVTPDPVDVGAPLTYSGYSIPDAEITIESQKDGSSASLKTFTTTSNGRGEWSIDVDTSGFSAGTYKVRAKAETATVGTDFSGYTYYGVGQDANAPLNADLNRDGSVNLTDFSILLFWWGSDGGESDPPADINQDGSVSLTDFSILLFNWTG